VARKSFARYSSVMRIVIATGIYPPEVGGPALYAKGVKESLERDGIEAPLALFSTFRSYPSGVRHVLYGLHLLKVARSASAIFVFDTYSVALPATVVGLILRIPVIIRVGGDFVWESYVERTQKLVPLPLLYTSGVTFNFKERVAFTLVKWMFRHTKLAFNTQWLYEIWKKPYGLSNENTRVVENAIGHRFESSGKDDGSILFFGRQIALKNHVAFHRAFARAQADGMTLELKEGIIPHAELIEKIRTCHAVAIPSISDVAPNNLIDALRSGKPFLLTKYSGYAEKYKDFGIIIDPLDEADMVRGLREIADPVIYERLCTRIKEYTEVRTYDDVAREMRAIL